MVSVTDLHHSVPVSLSNVCAIHTCTFLDCTFLCGDCAAVCMRVEGGSAGGHSAPLLYDRCELKASGNQRVWRGRKCGDYKNKKNNMRHDEPILLKRICWAQSQAHTAQLQIVTELLWHLCFFSPCRSFFRCLSQTLNDINSTVVQLSLYNGSIINIPHWDFSTTLACCPFVFAATLQIRCQRQSRWNVCFCLFSTWLV